LKYTRAVFNIFDALIKVGAASKSLNSVGLIFVGLF
jgi:lipoprotein signal peptidase